jgi:SAM-dependent methyltransferase
MTTNEIGAVQLQQIYQTRFEKTRAYRADVWRILIADFFRKFIRPTDAVLDLGCGFGEFINHVTCQKKFAMDLNPDSGAALAPDVTFLKQNCSDLWQLPDASLDVVFTSNFLEHLPNKNALSQTLEQARRCLRPSGRFIAMGPNIRRVHGAYWDFWDHHIPLTHLSLQEALCLHKFHIEKAWESFLPYTLVDSPRYPLFLLRLYLQMPFAWRFFGRQFLVIARKPEVDGAGEFVQT